MHQNCSRPCPRPPSLLLQLLTLDQTGIWLKFPTVPVFIMYANTSSQHPINNAGSSTQKGSTPLDATTQLHDIRVFERNVAKSVKSLRTLRRRYLIMVGLLLLSSVYWTWRLRAKLTDTAPRAPQETLRLWFAWALIGIVPTVIFFAVMYQSTVIMPSRFIERLNRSLSNYRVAYSDETGRLLRVSKPEPESSFREPVRLRASYRGKNRVGDH